MNKLLPLRFEHVIKLHVHGVVSLNKANAIIAQAVRANRQKKLSPKLSELAGLCQRVVVNPDIFKVMLHYHQGQSKEK